MPPADLPADPAASAEHLDTLDPRTADVLRLILRIAGGDFAARGEVTARRDELDAITVGLNMLAESFERERDLRGRAELMLADAIDAYENAPGLFCSVDAGSLRIVKCNATLAGAIGATKEMLHGRSVLELCTERSRSDLERALGALAAGETVRAVEVELVGAGGAPLTAALAASVTRDASGAPARFRLTLQDVTVERRLEAQLRHAQKMEAVGQLAGGVAHDFNNLLMVIQCATGLLERSFGERGPDAELLGQVRDAAERAATLTQQLLTFARRERDRPAHVDLAAHLLNGGPMLRRLLGPSIALDVRASLRPAVVRIDPARFDQALMNLVINARDAMPDGGTLTVIVDEDRLEATTGRADVAPCVRVSVVDSGPGIAPDALPRLFEPFFTTKPTGRGTGLGLAMVYGIVVQAGGEVRVQSSPGRGARFELRFPRVSAGPDDVAPRAPALVEPGGRETLLVVEDDASVRSLTAQVLRAAGYAVHEAASGRDALALDDAMLARIDLVVSDVIMPGLAGPSMIEALRHRAPSLRCMFMSGYAAGHPVGRDAFLAKPFSPGELLRAVRQALDATRPG